MHVRVSTLTQWLANPSMQFTNLSGGGYIPPAPYSIALGTDILDIAIIKFY